MKFHKYLMMGLDPSSILHAQGIVPDRWQRDVLLAQNAQILLNCSRQAGKSTVAAALALHTALFAGRHLVLLLSPGLRQSSEIFRKMLEAYDAIGQPVRATSRTAFGLELANDSRIVCLPGSESTIRGYTPDLLVIDEAARVPDDLYRSVRPMLAVSHGRLLALSTPFGQRGWFHDEWHGGGTWRRVRVPWQDCPRIEAAFIAEERRALGDDWVYQEFECAFTALTGLVYPDFEKTGHAGEPAGSGTRVGGIDWGWRNPFAAVWGVVDENDVLWIDHERYLRETPLAEHVRSLPRGVMWYCDPAGRTEMEEFRLAGHTIRAGLNNIRLGIMAVTARLRTGRLRIDAAGCPNLFAEARAYRYPSETERQQLGENPIDDNNHALSALRYLVTRLDQGRLTRERRKEERRPPPRIAADDGELWTPV